VKLVEQAWTRQVLGPDGKTVYNSGM
jgi:hypothetical protein